jgi:hypothetical protein
MQNSTSQVDDAAADLGTCLWHPQHLPIVSHVAVSGVNQPFFVDSGIFRGWSYVSVIVSLFGVVALFASGIGLLLMRPWARNLAIIYAAVTIVTTLIGLVITWLYVTQPLLEQIAGDDSADAMAAKFGAIGGLIGGCVGLAYPVLLWFFMMRPPVLVALASRNSSAAVPFEIIPRNDPTNPFSAPTTSELPVWNTEAGDSVADKFIPSKNGAALASYYLGLFSLFPCLGFPLGVAAVYFGIQGIRRVRKNPEVRGGVHAWVGTICGALVGLFNFALLVLLVIGFAANASR